MLIEGKTRFNAPVERVYHVFTDPDILARTTPGVQGMSKAGEDHYEATMKMGVAGISGTYQGTLTLQNQRPSEHYELAIAGSGTPGHVKGIGSFDFLAEEQGTTVHYVWDIQVGGLVAGVGQRVLTGVGRMMIDQFLKAMAKASEGE